MLKFYVLRIREQSENSRTHYSGLLNPLGDVLCTVGKHYTVMFYLPVPVGFSFNTHYSSFVESWTYSFLELNWSPEVEEEKLQYIPRKQHCLTLLELYLILRI